MPMSSSRGLCDVELVTPTGHTLRSLRALNCWYTQHPEYPKDLDLNNFHVETIELLWYKCFPETCSRLAIDKDILYIPNNFSFQEIPKYYWLWAFHSNNLISLLFWCRHSIQCKFIWIFWRTSKWASSHIVFGEPKTLYFHGHNFGISSKVCCLEQ